MADSSQRIVQKLWSYCNVLRDDGLSYQDYLEQLTFLLFLKMADEREKLTGERQPVPAGYRWGDLASPQMEGTKLEAHYRKTLQVLGQQGGMLGLIFRKAQNKIQDPAKLRQLVVELIGKEDWLAMSADVKGDAYEGLLERNAQDVKGGAGQYFTPRPLITAIVDCLQPQPGEVIVDPACGTGGFLLATHDYLSHHFKLDKSQKRHLALRGAARRRAGGRGEPAVRDEPAAARHRADRRRARPADRHRRRPARRAEDPRRRGDDQSAVRQAVVDHRGQRGGGHRPPGPHLQPPRLLDHHLEQAAQLRPARQDRSLKVDGRAAIVVPDNVLFEGGAGETVRRKLLAETELHTILRLPTGIFYAQGVKANVLFFDRKPGRDKPWTREVWFYDFRTNKHFTLKERRLTRARPRRVRRLLPAG